MAGRLFEPLEVDVSVAAPGVWDARRPAPDPGARQVDPRLVAGASAAGPELVFGCRELPYGAFLETVPRQRMEFLESLRPRHRRASSPMPAWTRV